MERENRIPSSPNTKVEPVSSTQDILEKADILWQQGQLSNTSGGIDEQAEIVVPRDKRGRILWSVLKENPASMMGFFQSEARRLQNAHLEINYKNMMEHLGPGITSKIREFYPGGVPGLRSDIMGTVERPKGYWHNPSTVKLEAQVFINKHGGISRKLLIEHGKNDLAHAINRYYDGGLHALKQHLGIVNEKKPPGYWSIERIVAEAQKFYKRQGALTGSLLKAKGREDLLRAISLHYPGRLTGLKTDLKIELGKKSDNYWVPEKIEEEVRAFFNREGNMSTYHMIKKGRADLAGAVSKYPGGIKALRKKLGIHINRKPEGYWIPENIEREAQQIVEEYGVISHPLLKRIGQTSLSEVISTKYPGGIVVLQKKLGIITRRNPSGYWTPEKILEKASEVLSKHGQLSHNFLRSHGLSGISAAINKYYPGKMKALREHLGVSDTIKPPGYWTAEAVEREALNFYKQTGVLTSGALKRAGKGNLATIIPENYPGGMAKLKEKLGIEGARKPKGYWTLERIESEAQIFFEEHGILTGDALLENGMGDLDGAIKANYPGRIVGLKQKLGIELIRKPASYWTSEKIEQEVMVFVNVHGKISHPILVANGRSDLTSAIALHYPGRWQALREKLNLLGGRTHRQQENNNIIPVERAKQIIDSMFEEE